MHCLPPCDLLEVRMLGPAGILTRSCAAFTTTRSPASLCSRNWAGRGCGGGRLLGGSWRMRCPRNVNGQVACSAAWSSPPIDTTSVVVEEDESGAGGGKIQQILRTPEIKSAVLIAGICSATLFSMAIFLRSLDNASGTRLALTAVALIGMKVLGSLNRLFKKGRWTAFLGLCIRTSLTVMLVGSFMMYLEEYFFEFSLPIFGAAAGIALVLSLLRHVLFTRFGEESELDKNINEYTDRMDKENLQTQVALRLSFLSIWLSSTVVFPFFEEILLRGVYVVSVVRSGISFEMATGLSALLFTCLRSGSFLEHAFNFILGGILTLAFIWGEGNLLLPILIHALVNSVTYCLEYRDTLI